MTIYCTYDYATSALYSHYRYVIAQNNNLVDVINIKIVNGINLPAQTYYIDFVCKTHGGVVKAKYSSPVLEYEAECLNFTVPNCLTQYEGYVEAQLVICMEGDSGKTVKSVGREGGIFEVAASANVLETHVIEPGNVLTELSTALLTAEKLNADLSQSIADADKAQNKFETALTDLDAEIESIVGQKMQKVACTLPFVNVEFWFYDTLVASYTVVGGNKVPEPEYAFPSDSVTEGWYWIEKDRHWDFSSDVAEGKDLRLYADVHNSSKMSMEDGVLVVDDSSKADIYLPFTFNGTKVKNVYVDSYIVTGSTFYLNDTDYVIENCIAGKYVVSHLNSRYEGGSRLIRKSDNAQIGLNPSSSGNATLDLEAASKCDVRLKNNSSIMALTVKGDMQDSISSLSSGAWFVFSIVILGNSYECNIGNYLNLQAIILKADTPELAKRFTYTSQNPNCKIYVPSEYMAAYESSGQWDGVELHALETYTGPDYSQINYPTEM